jgi:ring-1,2-phenylacetyl-CoA epoxidase subunit PaaC
VLEEDIALANLALDLIGQARLLLSHAAKLEGRGRGEDELAMQRDAWDFRNYTICELPNGEPVSHVGSARDYAFTVTRNFLWSAFQVELWQALEASSDRELAAIAEKSLKESRYHLRHSADWVVRLGDGTGESQRRMRRALELLWPYCNEFFAEDPLEAELGAAGIAPRGAALAPGWKRSVEPVLEEARLGVPAPAPFVSTGKRGVHTEHLGHLLSEMQFLQRTYPGGQW